MPGAVIECVDELGEFYRWWIFVGVRKLTPTYRAATNHRDSV